MICVLAKTEAGKRMKKKNDPESKVWEELWKSLKVLGYLPTADCGTFSFAAHYFKTSTQVSLSTGWTTCPQMPHTNILSTWASFQYFTYYFLRTCILIKMMCCNSWGSIHLRTIKRVSLVLLESEDMDQRRLKNHLVQCTIYCRITFCKIRSRWLWSSLATTGSSLLHKAAHVKQLWLLRSPLFSCWTSLSPCCSWLPSATPSFFSVLLRELHPELTSVTNIPLFAGEDCSWANTRAHLPLFCMWVATTAWLPMSGIGPRPGTEPGPLKQSVLNLTTRPPGWPQLLLLDRQSFKYLKRVLTFPQTSFSKQHILCFQ